MPTPPFPPPDSSLQDAPARSGVYDTVADKIGLVPNVRWKDNLIQALACGVCAVLGGIGGWLLGGDRTGFLVGMLLGLVGGLFLSGGVLMVVGLIRR